MSKLDISTAVRTILGLAIAAGVHYGIFVGMDLQESFEKIGYAIEKLYLLEFLFTILVFGLMVGTKKKLKDNLGYLFLGVIAVRLIVSYLFAKSGLDSTLDTSVFRYNFVIVVLIFLAGDTYIAYRILNNIDHIKKDNKKSFL